MTHDKRTETGQWVRCKNKECGQLIDVFELKQNGGKCPYCKEAVWEVEKSK